MPRLRLVHLEEKVTRQCSTAESLEGVPHEIVAVDESSPDSFADLSGSPQSNSPTNTTLIDSVTTLKLLLSIDPVLVTRIAIEAIHSSKCLLRIISVS